MHFKQQVRQPKSTAMDNKCIVHFTVIGDPVTLDEVLETYNVGYSLAAEPNLVLIPRDLALVGYLEATTIARHEKWILGPEDL
jgi:hypothetical protein